MNDSKVTLKMKISKSFELQNNIVNNDASHYYISIKKTHVVRKKLTFWEQLKRMASILCRQMNRNPNGSCL